MTQGSITIEKAEAVLEGRSEEFTRAEAKDYMDRYEAVIWTMVNRAGMSRQEAIRKIDAVTTTLRDDPIESNPEPPQRTTRLWTPDGFRTVRSGQ